MVAIRISHSLKVLRAATRAGPAPQTYRAPFATATPRFYAQGYGDGKGSPEGDNPQAQPSATKAQTELEHPGPDPPDVGKGTGAGPTKAAFTENLKKVGSSPEDASAQSGGSRSKEATETGSSPTGGDIGGSSSGSGAGKGTTTGGTPKDTSTANAASQRGGEALKGPQGEGTPSPKILNQSMPGAGSKEGLNTEQKQEVEQHNQDFEKRYDRGNEAPDDKVDKNFWSGHGGVKQGQQQGQQQGRTGTENDWNA